ncbi:hypothetical protein DC498_17535 [Terrimonas sp.]|nr:hypothetical protein DC498_17535 [Terrimonas sp.]
MWLVYLTLISKKKSSAVASKLSKIFISYFTNRFETGCKGRSFIIFTKLFLKKFSKILAHNNL